jgi:hypothetical protein
MLFSTKEGIERGLTVLEDAKLLPKMSDQGVAVIGQPMQGFVPAIPFILNADFYFQRKGGGIAMVPIFSRVPYLILSGDGNYYHTRIGNRLVPWANEHQRFVVDPYNADSMTIRSVLTTTKAK